MNRRGFLRTAGYLGSGFLLAPVINPLFKLVAPETHARVSSFREIEKEMRRHFVHIIQKNLFREQDDPVFKLIKMRGKTSGE